MSFSADVKAELARIKVEKKCDMLAEISGFFRVSGSLRLAGGRPVHHRGLHGKPGYCAALQNPD